MKTKILILLILLTTIEANSQILQRLSDMLDTPYDSSRIEDFDSKFFVKPIVAYRLYNYNYNDLESGKSFLFQSPTVLYAGVGGAFKNIQAQLIIPLYVFKKSGQEEAEVVDFNMGLKTNIINGALYYKSFRGFRYTEKKSDNEPGNINAELIKIGARGFWNFNSSYSMNAAYKQTQRQTKATGSFLAGVELYYFKNSFPDETIEPTFRNFGSTYNAAVLGGYAYTLPINKVWYISPVVLGGPVLQVPSKENTLSDNYEISYLYDFRLSAGFNDENWVAGIIAHLEANKQIGDQHYLNTRSLFLKFNLAYRF